MSSGTVFETAFEAYRVRRPVGQGGAGMVYEVEDEESNLFALKALDRSSLTRLKTKRFANELAFCRNCDHPHVIKVLDWGFRVQEGQRCPFYVMKLYPSTLRKIMTEGMPPDRVLPLFTQILDGVEAAHLQGIWHRDLKPENLLYDGASSTLVVADFGIAHFSEEDLQTLVETNPQERLANFQYAAPEQRTRGQQVDQRADIYALGLLLNEMFTGTPPLGTGYVRIEAVAPDFGYLDDLVDLLLRQIPDDRPVSIDNVKQQLVARGNDFISRQKLDRLKTAVIPTSEIDDPLVADPIRLVEVDYRDRKLVFKLSQPVNESWIGAFVARRNHTSIGGNDPESFRFRGDEAMPRYAVGDSNNQTLIDHFKNYLEAANQEYLNRLERDQRRQEEAEKKRLQEAIGEEENRLRILGNLNI